MSRYIISPSASRDLNEITSYFALRDVETGERFLHIFIKKCQMFNQLSNDGTRL